MRRYRFFDVARLPFLLIVGAGKSCRWMQRLHREGAAELTQLNPDQRAALGNAGIARRRHVTRPGRCRRSRRCLPRWPGRVVRQRCDRGLTTGDAVPPPDYADASRNTTPFLSLPLTFPRLHGTHSISYGRFSLSSLTCIVPEVDVWLIDKVSAGEATMAIFRPKV